MVYESKTRILEEQIKIFADEVKEENTEGVFTVLFVCLGGLGVTCSPRDPRFAGSNPAEVEGFFQDVKILSTSPPEGRSRV